MDLGPKVIGVLFIAALVNIVTSTVMYVIPGGADGTQFILTAVLLFIMIIMQQLNDITRLLLRDKNDY